MNEIKPPALLLSLSAFGAVVTGGVAQADAPVGVSGGAFVDAYYAYDFNRPSTIDRSYTTQPARHNEFNINLAYIEAKLERERVHGRLALQAGTSVQSNYAGEPTIGTVSGPSVSRNIQEGYVGYRLGGDTWIDGGIMLSHIGLESFISKDNLTYTRSLVADYSPYYQAGVRLTTKFSDAWTAQALILNGWQNISESNSNKAIGTQIAFAPSSAFSVAYNTFFGRESSFRQFHDLVFKFSLNETWSFGAQADLGLQDETSLSQDARWWGFTFIAKNQFTRSVAAVVRGERYSDPDQVLITTPSGASFKAWSASLGIDTTLDENVWWRNEARAYWADSAVFPTRSGLDKNDTVVVSSISAAF